MSRAKGDAGEYEFTRAAYDELQDAEKMYGVSFEVSLSATSQKGVWGLCVTAVHIPSMDGLTHIAAWRGAWPNSQSVSFASFLYAACHRTVRMVEAWHTSRLEEEAAKRGAV